MKGILLAGGTGSRLRPSTNAVSKQLIPIYDKPMIYYPLSVLMLAGVREIALISSPRDLPAYKNIFGTGAQIGLKFTYIEQPRPQGIAQALLLAEDFLAGGPCAFILGDNIFYGREFAKFLPDAAGAADGARVFAYHVKNPQDYGTVQLDENFRPLKLEEKPKKPSSPWALTGLYFYDGKAVGYARQIKPSARGELEITDINKLYLKAGTLRVQPLGRGIAWLDTGTHEGLIEASSFIHMLEKRQGLKIACLEAIAYQKGWISKKMLLAAAAGMAGSEYGAYLTAVAKESGGKYDIF
jgi:glucose-1-phosphate thymidylyltransferase